MAKKPIVWPPKVGTKFRNLHGDLCHVRGMVDNQLVYRFWIKHKVRWCYKVDGQFFYELCLRENRKPIKRRR